MLYKKMLLLFSLVFLLSACGGKAHMESYSRQDVDLGYISRIAVVPFENATTDQFVAKRVRDMAITQTLAFGLFDVVDKGVVDSALREEAIDLNKNTLNATDLRRLGQLLKVEAFMLGTVDLAGNVQRGSVSYPQLSLTLRLVDINSGMIIWQASGSRNGHSMGKRLFGVAADDEFTVALKLLRELLRTVAAGGETVIFEQGQQVPGQEGEDGGDDSDGEDVQDGEDAEMLMEQG